MNTWPYAPRLLEDQHSVTDAVVVGSLLICLLKHADRVEGRVPCATRQRDRTDHDRAGRPGLAADNLLPVRHYRPPAQGTVLYGVRGVPPSVAESCTTGRSTRSSASRCPKRGMSSWPTTRRSRRHAGSPVEAGTAGSRSPSRSQTRREVVAVVALPIGLRASRAPPDLVPVYPQHVSGVGGDPRRRAGRSGLKIERRSEHGSGELAIGIAPTQEISRRSRGRSRRMSNPVTRPSQRPSATCFRRECAHTTPFIDKSSSADTLILTD